MEPPITIVTDSSDAASFVEFLSKICCVNHTPSDPKWREIVLASSPLLGKFIISGIENGPPPEPHAIKLEMPESPGRRGFAAGSSSILDHIPLYLITACIAGGSRVLIQLIRAWVEERKSRIVRIKLGSAEFDIGGGISKEQIDKIVQLIEKRLR